MATYRLTDETGDLIEERDLDDDQAAIAWRSSHPFEGPSGGDSRQLRLERRVDGDWVRLGPLGTADVD